MNVRGWLRAVHRDAGYFVVGLTWVYAASGLAVNHIAEWDPNFKRYEQVHELGPFAPDVSASDDALAREVMKRLSVAGAAQEVYRASADELAVTLDRRTLHINPSTGRVIDQGEQPRLLLRAANWLHLNRGKKAWTLVADSYAVILLFLATSGLFMIKGRNGIWWRGTIVAALGAAVPIAYVVWAKP